MTAFRPTAITVAVQALVTSLALLPAVWAQDAGQRIEITGSSIKRIDAEGALPVQVIRRDEIARSGATSTTDLLQRLPAIQGGFAESSSVGGGAGGFTGVSVHNIGETRTLVLLNGHRLALFGGQSLTGSAAAIDLNAIPISAIERIEILTDGASALYGADAIAGVVNFITRRDTTDGDVTVGFTSPKAGAKEKRISASKGFGSLNTDGYNLFLTVSHDERTKLDASGRNFGNTGKVFFSQDGKNYRIQQFSAQPIPANAVDDLGQLVSPYRLTNGNCPEKTFRVIEPYNDGSGLVDDYCGFDFVGELEIYPVRNRDSVMASFSKRLGAHELFADVLYSKTTQITRIAPVPGSIAIPTSSPLHAKYLQPVGILQDTVTFYRLYDLGKRETRDTPKFLDLAFGSKGDLAGWDYNATFAHSESDSKTAIAGYPGALAVGRLRASGLLDPFVLAGQQSPAGQAAINATSYNGYWDGGTSKLDSFQLRGSKELMAMPGGPMLFGTGFSYQQEKFQSNPSLFAQGKLADPVAGTLCDPTSSNPLLACDQRFGDEAATEAYGANRKARGLFGELVMPLSKTFEATTSLRYDNYSDFGNATTYKAGFRWTPQKNLLIRGSVGTGFHAPTVPQVNATLQPFGVTSDKYLCSPGLAAIATSLSANCQPGNKQYDQLAGGNPNLQPETSRQATLGLRFEPNREVSAGFDLWHVAVKDSFGQLTEQEVFANPQSYLTSWGTKRDTGTGVVYLAFKADNRNLGKSYQTGVDVDVLARGKMGFGDVVSNLKVTYMIREAVQLQKGGAYYSAIGNFAELGYPTFRWQGTWANTLKAGNWTHTGVINMRSGYLDQVTTAEVLDGAGNVVGSEDVRLKVPQHFTFDWQSSWTPRKDVQITLGMINVFDTTPPLSISTGGLNRGQQFGFDDRFYDSRGRMIYGNFSYKF